MTDTRLGTYGCLVLVLYICTKLGLQTVLGVSSYIWMDCTGAGPAMIVTHTMARWVAAIMVRTRNYVEEAGPKQPFYRFMIHAKHLVSWARVGFGLCTCFIVATICYGPAVAIALLTVVVGMGYLAGAYGAYVLGGVMGDFLGASICITEIVLYASILSKDSASKCLRSWLFKDTWIQWNASFCWKDVSAFSTCITDTGLNFLEDDRAFALVRFTTVIFLTILWSKSVGCPNVVLNDTLNSLNAEDVVAATSDLVQSHSAVEELPGDSDREPNSGKSKQHNTDSVKNGSWMAGQGILTNPEVGFSTRYKKAREYVDSLAKPMGSLGTLEDWAARIAALQRTLVPSVANVTCLIFAADHGMAADAEQGGEGCSSYPQTVTRSILDGLKRGVAGASVLARANKVHLKVIDLGVLDAKPLPENNHSIDGVAVSKYKLPNGTRNACQCAAMTLEETNGCMQEGKDAVRSCHFQGCQLLVFGEVGIGNTTTSSLLLAAIMGGSCSAASVCDGGATLGRAVDEAAVQKKIDIVEKALSFHRETLRTADVMSILTLVGGAEIAALVGAMQEASRLDVPFLVDGFIVTVAALVAVCLDPQCCRGMLFASRSPERGQWIALQKIREIAVEGNLPVPAEPALSMGLRMGEGSAALLAVPIVQSATAMLREMATIQDILGGGDSR